MNDGKANNTRLGRPRSESAESQSAIFDAVVALLQEKSMRDLTMEAIAKRAGVGKPTLYKWWPTKAALAMAVFHERFTSTPQAQRGDTAEAAIRGKVRRLINEFNGLFGKVMADLLAEGQSEPQILQQLFDQHISARRAAAVADVERGIAAGEFSRGTNPGLMIESIIGPIYFRMLLRQEPLTEQYADALIDQVIRGLRPQV